MAVYNSSHVSNIAKRGRSPTLVSHEDANDRYIGTKNWSELTTAQQNTFISSELNSGAGQRGDNAMRVSLKKEQADGFSALCSQVTMLLSEAGVLEDGDRDTTKHHNMLCMFLDGSAIGKRILQALRGQIQGVQPVDDAELHDLADFYADDHLDDTLTDARAAIVGDLQPATLFDYEPAIATLVANAPADADVHNRVHDLGGDFPFETFAGLSAAINDGRARWQLRLVSHDVFHVFASRFERLLSFINWLTGWVIGPLGYIAICLVLKNYWLLTGLAVWPLAAVFSTHRLSRRATGISAVLFCLAAVAMWQRHLPVGVLTTFFALEAFTFSFSASLYWKVILKAILKSESAAAFSLSTGITTLIDRRGHVIYPKIS